MRKPHEETGRLIQFETSHLRTSWTAGGFAEKGLCMGDTSDDEKCGHKKRVPVSLHAGTQERMKKDLPDKNTQGGGFLSAEGCPDGDVHTSGDVRLVLARSPDRARLVTFRSPMCCYPNQDSTYFLTVR